MSDKKPVESISSMVTRYYRLRVKFYSKLYSNFGLSRLQAATLRAVHYNDGCIQKELCNVVDIAPSVMVGILDSLERMKLIERRQNPSNRRSINVFITDNGQAVFETLQDIVRNTDTRILSKLDEEEQVQLLQLLEKAYGSWLHHSKGYPEYLLRDVPPNTK